MRLRFPIVSLSYGPRQTLVLHWGSTFKLCFVLLAPCVPLVFRLNSESSPLVLPPLDGLQSQEKNEGTTLMYVEVRGSLKKQFSLL